MGMSASWALKIKDQYKREILPKEIVLEDNEFVLKYFCIYDKRIKRILVKDIQLVQEYGIIQDISTYDFTYYALNAVLDLIWDNRRLNSKEEILKHIKEYERSIEPKFVGFNTDKEKE